MEILRENIEYCGLIVEGWWFSIKDWGWIFKDGGLRAEDLGMNIKKWGFGMDDGLYFGLTKLKI